jgi:predicted CXXCH cytochrome family protein
MTQVVTPESMIAKLGTIEHPYTGEQCRVERQGDEFWVGLPRLSLQNAGSLGPNERGAPEAPAEGTKIWRRLVMSTGAHHYQLYWYPIGLGREIHMLPFVFLQEDQRWVPRASVFLTPPGVPEQTRTWNANCICCHSTDGQPSYSSERVRSGGARGAAPDSRAAEFGIACEACHGPGRKHAETMQRQEQSKAPRKTAPEKLYIVHPRKIAASRSAEIGGQCHSVNFPYDREGAATWLSEGPVYRPGEELGRFRYVVQPETVSKSPLVQALLRAQPRFLETKFWPDGKVRVIGREYNGLIDSPCFKGGEFSCVSCHSQHESEPDDLLSASNRGDQPCLKCHESFGAELSKHTHHHAESSGSRCYNCHMPHTRYGLLNASRSHAIDSPSVASSVESGRPNACNACHLDRTLAWTARRLTEWYGAPPAELNRDRKPSQRPCCAY